jgi:hypothetical protein
MKTSDEAAGDYKDPPARDYCAALLSEKKNEAFLLALFRLPKGEWASVHGLCVGAGVSLKGFEPDWMDLAVMWLDDPVPSTATCLVIFYSLDDFWLSVEQTRPRLTNRK